MPKAETPPDFLSPARPPRPARGRSDASSSAAPALGHVGAFGDAKGPGSAQSALRFYPAIAGGVSADHASAGHASATSTAEQRSHAPRAWQDVPPEIESTSDFIGAGSVPELESQFGANFGAPRSNNPLGQLPMARLEEPSLARLELTPSPVPRVSLVPATGSLDISLVPGPHSIGSRNLPTLAARHAVGRAKQVRRAPAVTLPPPAAAARDPRGSQPLVRGVKSSRREIVLGLTIGIGLSLLLAALGQAYLAGERPVAASPSLGTEALALGARPQGSPAADLPAPASNPVAPDPVAPSAAVAPGPEVPPKPASAVGHARKAGAEAADDVSSAAPAARRAASARKERALRTNKSGPRPSDAFQSEAGAAFDGSASEKTPLSPSESAGLGLDLPL